MSTGIDETETDGAVGTTPARRATWDERYAAAGYLFGTAPSTFLTKQRGYLVPDATALAIADGEGRNSVYLAECGLKVTAMDASEVAVAKARALADARGVSADFHEADILDWDWSTTTYDIVVGIFIQFLAPDDRKTVFAGMKRSLKPGGVLLLHGYRPTQVDYGTGGPPHRENMYNETDLSEAFDDMEILRLTSYDCEIAEGTGHAGMSALIDLVARKRR